MIKIRKSLLASAIVLAGMSFASSVMATTCASLPKAAELKTVLMSIDNDPQDSTGHTVNVAGNSGLSAHKWAVLMDSSGIICAVVHSLPADMDVASDLPLAHRVYAAQKAYTTNTFSHNAGGLSSANLYLPALPSGSLSSSTDLNGNVDFLAGDINAFGTTSDPLVGKRIGGYNGSGGGLTLYDKNYKKAGAIGVSGDTACAAHIVAWKVREQLGNGAYSVAHLPWGPINLKDSMIQDIKLGPYGGQGTSPSTLGHPKCTNNPTPEQAGDAIVFQ
jgi:hypothetical protein